MSLETVGVLGGTFDPVHLGHLHVALGVKRVFGLARVLLVPCANPSHKAPVWISPSAHRLAMLRLAIEGLAGLEVSTLEVDRGGTSFTIDTLRALRGSGGIAPLFILGIDALADLPTWREHLRLVEEFDLVDHSDSKVPGDRAFPGRPLVNPAGKFCKGCFHPAHGRIPVNTKETDIFLLFRQEKRGEPYGLPCHHCQHS